MSFIEKAVDLKSCFDFDYSMTCVNQKMLHNKILNLIIKHLDKPISIRGIDNSMHNINEYVVISCFMKRKLSNDSNHLIKFIMKIYLIDDLKTNILININIIKLQKMNLLFVNNILIINVYRNLKISINTIIKANLNIRRTI